MSAKQFFKKVGGDIEHAFKKTGSALKATFKKGGYVDKGLGKVADVAKQVGKYAAKAGGVVAELAPTAALIPGIGPELAVGLAGAGTLAKKIGGTAGRVSKGVAKVQDVKNQTVKNVGNAIRGQPIQSTLEKPAPVDEDMIGLSGMAGYQFE
jgi:hypothetical protein